MAQKHIGIAAYMTCSTSYFKSLEGASKVDHIFVRGSRMGKRPAINGKIAYLH